MRRFLQMMGGRLVNPFWIIAVMLAIGCDVAVDALFHVTNFAVALLVGAAFGLMALPLSYYLRSWFITVMAKVIIRRHHRAVRRSVDKYIEGTWRDRDDTR